MATGTRAAASFFLLVSFALVAAFAAEQRGVALREWRTLFLSAAVFALLLHETLRGATDRKAARTFLALAWLAGGAFVALTGLWQYVTEQNIIQAEGVNRVRAFYGSPNNLGLYLERTAAVGLALVFFRRLVRWERKHREECEVAGKDSAFHNMANGPHSRRALHFFLRSPN